MLRMKKYSVISACIAMGLSFSAYADLNIKNNSDGFATAQVGTICSSMIGEQGIISPHATTIVPSIVFDLYCPTTCEAKVYIAKSCEGEPIATVAINHDKGVTGIYNHKINGYYLLGSGTSVTIEGVG